MDKENTDRFCIISLCAWVLYTKELRTTHILHLFWASTSQPHSSSLKASSLFAVFPHATGAFLRA